jgi:hypothetical protein
MAFPMLAALGAIMKAGSGIATGVGTARAAKKLMLTDAEKRELEDLEKRQLKGELGLTDKQKGAAEQGFLASQAGAQRQLEALGIQQAAAQGAGIGGGITGRDIFLREQAKQSSIMDVNQKQNAMMAEADIAAANEERARIDNMRAQQKKAESMRAQGIAQAVSGGLGGAGEGVQMVAAQQHQVAVAEAQVPKLSNAELGASYGAAQKSYDSRYGPYSLGQPKTF